MIHTKNKISGDAKPISLIVREYIARHCVTIASYIPDQYLDASKEELAQTKPTFAKDTVDKTKNHLSLKGVTNK